jgi:hypothetical protein
MERLHIRAIALKESSMTKETFIRSAISEAIHVYQNVDTVAKERYEAYCTLKNRYKEITLQDTSDSRILAHFASHLFSQGISEFSTLQNFSSEVPKTSVIPFFVCRTTYGGNGHTYGTNWVFFRADNLSPNVCSYGEEIRNPGFTRNAYPPRDEATWETPNEEQLDEVVSSIMKIWDEGTSPLAEFLTLFCAPLGFLFSEEA